MLTIGAMAAMRWVGHSRFAEIVAEWFHLKVYVRFHVVGSPPLLMIYRPMHLYIISSDVNKFVLSQTVYNYLALQVKAIV